MALGRSDLFLKLEIIKKIVNIAVLLLTVKFGVMAIAYGILVMEILGLIINTWPNKKLIGYSYKEQLLDILPTLALTAFMALCVYAINFAGLHVLLTFVLQVIAGVVIYVIGSIVFKFETF